MTVDTLFGCLFVNSELMQWDGREERRRRTLSGKLTLLRLKKFSTKIHLPSNRSFLWTTRTQQCSEKIATKRANNKTITFFTHRHFATLLFLLSCFVHSLLTEEMDWKAAPAHLQVFDSENFVYELLIQT